MNWQDFSKLSKDYRDIQLKLLVSGCPEAMDLRGLSQWGQLCAKSLTYSYKVEQDDSQPDSVKSHWKKIREHSVLQLRRTADSLAQYIDEAEELSPYERCTAFNVLSLCAQTFQEEADLYRPKDEASTVPSSVSQETLAVLASIKQSMGKYDGQG